MMTNFWENKKIIAYIALTHHVRFISPVMEKLAGQGAKVHYIVGQAERSQEITAIHSGLDYSHIFDFVSDQDHDEIQRNYLKLRTAFSGNLKNNFLFGASPITVIDKTIYATAVEYVGFKNLLKDQTPDLCLALHELHRWGKMFAFWAKKYNVPVITFQEGLYFALDYGYIGHVQNSTLNLVWGERIKKKLADFEAPEEKIIPVGNTHLSHEIECQKKERKRDKKRAQYQCKNALAILLLFSGEVPAADQLLPVFKSIAQTSHARLFVKFHPVTPYTQIKDWILSLPDEYQTKFKVFHEDENTYDLMSLSDVCVIVQPSTTGLEALCFDKPLVHLDIKMKQKLPYSFSEFDVAIKMTPKEFANAIRENKDFKALTKKEKITHYLKEELSQTTTAVDTVVDICEKLIEANTKGHLLPIQDCALTDKDWSIIIPLSDSPKDTLMQLEAIALNSENSGTFEVILIQPEALSNEMIKILDTLKGDVIRLPLQKGSPLPEMMNKASSIASGKTLLFFDMNIMPLPEWLYHLEKGIKKHGTNRILGARIIDRRNSLVHAGIVLDTNHAPVSAYKHLSGQFPQAMKARSFQMLDHFICINKTFFHQLGGFCENAGQFAFMDICLRADTYEKIKDRCQYIPEACMVSLSEDKRTFDSDASIYFFGRWHGALWDNQSTLYSADKITKAELDAAQIAQSMATANLVD
ncbi:MAG: hypothetical protein KKE62_11465 [Proteobacteria bacterium]|nr:hypothetical protein [Pseudomonadota bacterium]MBU1388894.1 hypothetical protein [Pseudomonadota bacterium]MBU1543446.1 hypothetical protein [Pseudomonadota bacterium]